MAVTVTATRNRSRIFDGVIRAYDTLTISGTYTPGGFPLNPSTIVGGQGTSPTPGSTVLAFDTYSPLGYTYVLIGTGANAKIKAFAGTTELAAGTAMPDATLSVIFEYAFNS